MQSNHQSEYDYQRRIISAMMSGIGNVRLHETHISWVLIAGHYAYKIKKAVDLGFLDFSSLQARHFYCEEEIRLNRRLAPNIYLDVIAIGGSAESPVLGRYPAIEYAVRMREFPVASQLDRLAASNKILPQHIDALAALVAKFHLELPASIDRAVFGTPASVRLAAEQNFEQLQALLSDSNDLKKLAILRQSSERELSRCRSIIEERLLQGFVRECHGDLHLGNIVLIDEQPIPFDGIEFNPELRWMDVISEVAFSVMDLQYFKLNELACRFLNDYLEITGDYAGVKLLRFYMAYRAMVRAKVNAIRACQADIQPGEKKNALIACREYMALAARCFSGGKPALIITHGLPGSGKSTFAQLALERLQAICLRSDVERKRLFGLSPLADSRASTGLDLYNADISKQTYARLFELASGLLSAGMTVIVDAAFLMQEQREHFHLLACRLDVPFAIASAQASEATLHARIAQRQRAAEDASEADAAVLEKLQATQESLTPDEKHYTAEFVNEKSGIAACSAGWTRLEQLLDTGLHESGIRQN